MSVKCRRSLVYGQNRMGKNGFLTYITCSTRRTGYEPPRFMSSRTSEVERRDVMA